MPCSDSNAWSEQLKDMEKERIDALLCSACRVLTRLGYDFDENPALSAWWEKHQKKDEIKKHPPQVS